MAQVRDTTISTPQVTYTIRTYSPAIFILPTTQLTYYSCESPSRIARFARATCTVQSMISTVLAAPFDPITPPLP